MIFMKPRGALLSGSGGTLSITHIFVIFGDLGLRLFGLLFSCATAVSAVVLGLLLVFSCATAVSAVVLGLS